jgi:hypothetical protein
LHIEIRRHVLVADGMHLLLGLKRKQDA